MAGNNPFDLDAMVGTLLQQAPGLIRPQIESFLRERGLQLLQEISSDVVDVRGSSWTVHQYVLQSSPHICLMVCRWHAGHLLNEDAPTEIVKARLLSPSIPIDKESLRGLSIARELLS
jgi:hypothetical protein